MKSVTSAKNTTNIRINTLSSVLNKKKLVQNSDKAAINNNHYTYLFRQLINLIFQMSFTNLRPVFRKQYFVLLDETQIIQVPFSICFLLFLREINCAHENKELRGVENKNFQCILMSSTNGFLNQ